jgi:hypothetical protein
VYVYGNVSMWQIARVGALQDFTCQVLPANCAPDAATQALYVDQLAAAGVKIPLTLGEQRALQIKNAAGSTISVSGPKSATGALVGISKIEVAKPTGTHTQTFIGSTEQYFELGTVHLHLKKQGDGTWLGTFRDVETGTEYQHLWPAVTAGGTATPVVTALANAPENGVAVSVQTKSCGQRQDFTRSVRLAVKNSAGLPLATTFPTTRAANGTVQGFIPNPARQAQQNLQYVKEVVDSVMPLADAACAALATTPATDAMCSPLSLTAMTTAVGSTIAGKFQSACGEAISLAKAVCEIGTTYPLPDNALTYLDASASNQPAAIASLFVSPAEQFSLDGSVTPEHVGQSSVSPGTEVDLTASTTSVASEINLEGIYCNQNYSAKVTVRSFYIPPIIVDGNASMFCGPDDAPWVVGGVETRVDQWKLSGSLAEVVGFATGTFNAGTGAISAAEVWGPDPIQEIFFSSGQEVFTATRGLDGAIRGTATEQLVTTWTRDSRRAECTAVYDYEATPTYRP